MSISYNKNKSIDLIKGFTIILVVLGHCIQFGSGADYMNQNIFFDNFIFKLIYSFHMPLFAAISGYLFYFSIIKYGFKDLLIRKLKQLLIPIITTSIINIIINIILKRVNIGLNLNTLKYIITIFYTNLWFLWAILFCSVVVLLINKFFLNSIYVYLIVFLLLFITPDSLNLYYFKFLYPFFIIGFFFNKLYLLKNNIYNWKYLILSFVIHILLLLFFDNNIYIYNTGFTIIGKENIFMQIFYNLFRILAGISGIVLALNFINYIKNKIKFIDKIVLVLGKQSMGIYIVSGYIFSYILPKLTYNFKPNIFINLIETTGITFICYLIVTCLNKSKILNKFLLGSR